jgi:hypothetical protein
MNELDTRSSSTKGHSVGDDGRTLWWAIPAAVASVLGIAGAIIAHSRRMQPLHGTGQTRASKSVSAGADAAAKDTVDTAPGPMSHPAE